MLLPHLVFYLFLTKCMTTSPQISVYIICCYCDAKTLFVLCLLVFGLFVLHMLQSLMHYLTANLAQLTLERTHPGLTSIVTDNIQNGFIRDFELAFAHPIAFHLLGDQMLFGNIEFFILRVARQE